ncbi:von Willebrand factor type A domain protein [uncultured archaeon]|nr:von Willebrand factor type A domain protein [uncultured archaeon]
MNPNYTDVTLVLDRSGSMGHTANDTIGGINEFIKEQQGKEGKKVCFTLVQFDADCEDWYLKNCEGQDINTVALLDKSSYKPRGGTALIDAMAQAILETGKRLGDMPEDERPANVIFAVMTDGEENSSRKYTNQQVFDMIKHQTDVYKWAFLFLGANQDAIASGSRYGFMANNSLSLAGFSGYSGVSGISGYSGYSGCNSVYATRAVNNFVSRVVDKGVDVAYACGDTGGAFLKEDYAVQDLLAKSEDQK